MGNTDLEILKEKVRIFREKFIEKTKHDNNEKGIEIDEAELIAKITVKLLGQIEIQVDGETVKKDVFLIEIEGEAIGKIYDEDLAFIGAMMRGQEGIMLSSELSSKPEQEQSRIKEELKKLEPKSAKTIDELEGKDKNENETEKKEIMAKDLEEKMGETGIKINSYRKIIDPAFMRQFPETCQGALEVGMAYLDDGRCVLVADYGNGFEVAKGTEPGRQTSDKMYDIDKGERSVEEKSPHALIKITGNGQKEGSKELSVTFGKGGYMETKIVDRTNGNLRLATDIQQTGEGTGEAIDSDHENVMGLGGENAAEEIIAMVSPNVQGKMENSIVSDVLEACTEQLQDLYGDDKAKQENVIRTYIERIVSETANIDPNQIKESVMESINQDWEMTCNRGRSNH